jgi:hypothetical protein
MSEPPDPFEGLVDRKLAARIRRQPMGTTEPEIDNPFNDGLPEGDDEPEPEAGETPPMTPLQARAAEQSKRATSGRRRRRGPRQQPGAEASGRPYIASNVPEGLESRDAAVFWPQILKEMADKGVGPEDMYIRIDRIGRGITPQGQVTIDQVDANLVCGDQTGDAGRDLVTYVTDIVHLGREKLNSPADYKLYVVMKQGLSQIRMMTLHLDHPDEIRALQQRKSAYFRPQPPGYRASPRAPVGMGAPMQQQPQAPLPPPPPVPVPNPQLSQTDQFNQMLQFMQSYETYRQQVAATGAPMPAPLPPQIIQAPAPPPPREEDRLSAEEKELIEEGRIRRFLEKNGYVKAGVGAPPPPAAAAQAAQNPVSAVKDLIKTFAEIQGLEGQVKAMFGIADKEEPDKPEETEKPDPVKVVQIPGATAFGRPVMFPRGTEGFLDWCQQAVMANLETSGELAANALGTFAKSLDGTSFSRLLDRLTAQGGAPAQVAAQAKAAGVIGTGATNGAAPMIPRRGPTA